MYRSLVDHFGSESIVFDIDAIPLGADFREYLNQEVSKCEILLAVMGDQWLEILKQRLDQPNYFVRIEIQAALKRGIPVVPILVGKKSVPNEKDLPPKLTKLSYRQAAEVRAGADLQSHLNRLIEGLYRLLPEWKAEDKITQTKERIGKIAGSPLLVVTSHSPCSYEYSRLVTEIEIQLDLHGVKTTSPNDEMQSPDLAPRLDYPKGKAEVALAIKQVVDSVILDKGSIPGELTGEVHLSPREAGSGFRLWL
ncbi:MAG: hypothetical protein PVI42_19555 [Desulfobacterales bacterium]